MDLLADLTPAQREAVTHIDGPLLVLAGAGSGKTRVITRRVAHLLGSGIPADSVLALTFTNKAAGEMRERIDALVPSSRVWVGTFHGFCARLLRKYATLVGIDPGFSIYDQNDRRRAVKDVMDQVGWDVPGWTPERVESAISRAKNDLVNPDAWHRRGPPIARTPCSPRSTRPTRRGSASASAVDFDDLLVHMVAILKEHKDVRADLDRRFRYVLVDEYQDTNLAQYAIVRALSVDHPNLCVTGDPDQSIYGWRGANLTNILEFERDYPGCRVVTLQHNYRSTKNILSVADHLIRNNRNRKPKSLLTENPRGAPVELTIYPRETDEAEGVAGRIAALVREGEYGYRRHRRLLPDDGADPPVRAGLPGGPDPLSDRGRRGVLRAAGGQGCPGLSQPDGQPQGRPGLPAGGQRPAAGAGQDLARDPLGRGAASRACRCWPWRGRPGPCRGSRRRPAEAFDDFARLIDELSALRDLAAEEVIRQLLVADRLSRTPGGRGQGRAARIGWRTSTSSSRRPANSTRSHPGASIQDFLAEITLASPIDRWDQDTGAVTLMTLHAAKGLEFPVGLHRGPGGGHPAPLPRQRGRQASWRRSGGSCSSASPGPAASST